MAIKTVILGRRCCGQESPSGRRRRAQASREFRHKHLCSHGKQVLPRIFLQVGYPLAQPCHSITKVLLLQLLGFTYYSLFEVKTKRKLKNNDFELVQVSPIVL